MIKDLTMSDIYAMQRANGDILPLTITDGFVCLYFTAAVTP